MTTEIVGRENELASIRAFFEAGRAALVLEGEAGIGKSTLWLAGIEYAREAGVRALSTRPAQAEQGLVHSGLGDLLEDVLDDVLPALEPPRRRALEVALLLEEPDDDPVDTSALAVAVRGALQHLGEQGPLLIAIDDVQWLDASSSSALAFALRRLGAVEVRFMLARRLEGEPRRTSLEVALGDEQVQRLSIGPLSVGALHRLLLDRLDRSFPRQTLLRIHERSGGNPFFALELARVLDAEVDPLQPLPVPDSLDELVRTRLADLPPRTREALALASAVGTTSESLLQRAGIAPTALKPAFAAHVVEREAGTIRFTHPLLSSALYRELGAERTAVHARLANLVEDPLIRARHLALSKEDADEEVASVLDEATRIASSRGASAVAAELAEQALRLTPNDDFDARHRRALAAARAHQAAGEWIRSRTIAMELQAEPELGSLRADVLVLLSDLESIDRSIPLLEEALREASAQPALRAAIHLRLAWAKRYKGGFRHARAALALAEELNHDVLRSRGRAVLAVLSWFAGEGEAPEDLPSRVHDFAIAVGGEHLVCEGTQAVVNTLAPASRRESARALLEREHREGSDRDERRAAQALWGLAWVEFWEGRWELAAEYAERAHDISIQYGLEVPQDHLPIAVIAVHRGRLELARRHSQRALELGGAQSERLQLPQHRAVLGLASLWEEGDRATAERWLGEADRCAAELDWHEPSVRWWAGDYAELLLELGRIDDAVQVIDAWDADAQRVARQWILGHVTRTRGLVAAAQGRVDEAQTLLQRAVTQHEGTGDPYGRARGLLALGVVRRRTRQKRAARETIQAALDGFEQLGAATWIDKALAEIGSIGGRTRSDGLTPAEQRVAALVAEGRTNREVAAALFLGERTVSSHLTHIYAKLGIRSRTELARLLG
jgi:DNA-binding CsgD family transcriptional regulator/tetratricopeptide (TPR) repeat protein